ncbi:unnamed protein product [Auanema sp. JU1783]|nr:unnamed protein product [Auanema sp. JU1783]
MRVRKMTHAVRERFQLGQNIETYVFLDFGTTGFYPEDDQSNKSPIPNVVDPRIVEIGMVAVERSDFEEAVTKIEKKEDFESIAAVFTCPVNHGLTGDELDEHLLRIQPAQEVHTFSEEKCFGEEWSDVKLFLDGLKKPICFVALGGSEFHFRVLLSELQRAHIDLQESLKNCFFADSISAFTITDHVYYHRIKDMDTTNSINQKKQLKSEDPFQDLEINNWPFAIKARFQPCFIRKDDGDWSFSESSYKKVKKSYKIEVLYQSIFGESFSAHNTVDNCKAVLKLCLAFNTAAYFDKSSGRLVDL